MTLAELQIELLKVDVQDGLKPLIAPVTLMIAGAIVLLGCIPVLLAALALGLIAAGLVDWQAFLAASAIGLAVAAIIGTLGWWRLRKLPAVFGRSRDEFKNNVAWVKGAFTSTNDKATGPTSRGSCTSQA